jgi:UDP-N-acetylmuramoylalanine--D-glutamate ligase
MTTRTVILGAGESGTGAAILARHLGHDVFVSDLGKIPENYTNELLDADVTYEQGKHSQDDILNADQIILSPGIPPTVDIVQKAMDLSIPVISEIEFGALNTSAILIGITGTNGKTTTSMLTYHILSKAGLKVGLAGNVGRSLARQVVKESFDYYIIELSSFQLDLMFNTRLHYAVLLNITPDHLDRYNSYDDYVQSKFRITQNQEETDRFIYSLDSEPLTTYLEKHPSKAINLPFSLTQKPEPGGWADDQNFHITIYKPEINFIMNLHQLTIGGRHNTYNSMAASIIANSLLIRNEMIRESLMDFKNVEHRLEYVATVKGVDYINDSKATNVNSAWYALESMKKSVVWVAGGIDKGNDYESLIPLVHDKVRILICLGKNNLKIHHAFSSHVDMIINTESAEEAVTLAQRFARKDEVVLLSPACASFDLFDNYEDRGRAFKVAVRDL